MKMETDIRGKILADWKHYHDLSFLIGLSVVHPYYKEGVVNYYHEDCDRITVRFKLSGNVTIIVGGYAFVSNINEWKLNHKKLEKAYAEYTAKRFICKRKGSSVVTDLGNVPMTNCTRVTSILHGSRAGATFRDHKAEKLAKYIAHEEASGATVTVERGVWID